LGAGVGKEEGKDRIALFWFAGDEQGKYGRKSCGRKAAREKKPHGQEGRGTSCDGGHQGKSHAQLRRKSGTIEKKGARWKKILEARAQKPKAKTLLARTKSAEVKRKSWMEIRTSKWGWS